MKKSKHSNYHKIVAFVLIAIVIVSAVGFVVNGWQPILDSEENGEKVPNEGDANDSTGQNQGATDEAPVVTTPKYYNYLTGLEVSEEASKKMPFAFLTDPSMHLYGVSSSPLTVEFPLEDGKTRLLVYSDNITALGKIGAMKPTRGYISNLIKHLGGGLITLGCDDIIEYDKTDVKAQEITLSVGSGFYYTEMENAFSNGDLIRAALGSLEISTELASLPRLPFVFSDLDAEAQIFDASAIRVSIPHGNSATELLYDQNSHRYTYCKAGALKTDMLNAATVEYDNVFILLADTVTHETADGTELIVNTVGSGVGYYLTGGTYTAIRWVNDGEIFTFYDTNDNKLTVNRGTSYVSFMKSASAGELSIS